MFEFFLNPANAVVGGALIASPIIIHLINRLRFRRIRWAAMEFLLKSQKRNRRRLIIEQLILLLLRILLVILTAMLLARFLGFSFAGLIQPPTTVHVVLLDDRLSMTDHWRTEEGDVKTAFDAARQLIEKEIAKPASQARTPQRLVLLRLSDPTRTDFFDQRLTEDSLKDLSRVLAGLDECTALHLDLDHGVQAARDLLAKNSKDLRFLHIVSDFRQRQWEEPAGAALAKTLDSLSAMKVKINLVDAAHPVRTESQQVPLYHDNLAILDLRPQNRIVAERLPASFNVTVANFSPSERKNVRVTIKVGGVERSEASFTILSLPPGISTQTFQLTFVDLGYNQITANLENEEVGVAGDNLRYAVVDVRRQVPILLIDGDLTAGDKPGGDSFHLRSLFTVALGYDVVRRGAAELEQPNLDQYATIYLLNVRDLKDKALQNLDTYTANGGSVAFFLADRVTDLDFYNKKLYAGGKGLMPVPLTDRPTQPLSDADKEERRRDGQPKIFIRKDDHPLFAEAFKDTDERAFFLNRFCFIIIDRYFPVSRVKWTPGPEVEELLTLPNRRPVEDYQDEAKKLRDALPVNEEKYAPYRPGLEKHQRGLRDAMAGKHLYELANALEALLQDPGVAEDPKQPSMVEFWKQTDPAIADLRNRLEKLRERVRYGDPLLVAGRFGKGRTVAFLSSAGTNWNDWAGGGLGSTTYGGMVLALQKFLASTEGDAGLTVGSPMEMKVDGTRFQPKMKIFYQGEIRDAGAAKPAAADAKEATDKNAAFQDLGELSGSESGGQVAFLFQRSQKPGVYYFDLAQRTDPGAEPKTERRAVAFNVDGPNESDLKRQSRPDLERVAGGANVHLVGTHPTWANQQTDLSESAWFYLLFLLILIAEQAMAVHLSFHLKANEAPLAAPTAKAQAA